MNDPNLPGISLALHVVRSAWFALAPTIARLAETDDELHDLVVQVSRGLDNLDRGLRRRERDVRG